MKIEKIHKRNFELIKEYDLKEGTVLKFKEDCSYFKKEDLIIIKTINKYCGWVLFERTQQLPQEIEKILNLCEVKK